VTIRNNRFINFTWSNTTGHRHNGAIKIYQNCLSLFKDQPYNENIRIEDNLFQGIRYRKGYAAIDVANAQDVRISGNRFVDCLADVQVEKKSTVNIAEAQPVRAHRE
jgi:hypothetical protein